MPRRKHHANPVQPHAPVRAPKRSSVWCAGRPSCAPCCSLGSAAAQANAATITAPVLGLVFDSGAAKRALPDGYPGASWVDGALNGTPLSAVAISSQQAYALALEAGTGAAFLVSQSGQQPLAGVRAGAQLVSVSPGGTDAVAISLTRGRASILTGLPGAPQALVDVTLDGPPSGAGVSDDGNSLAAVISFAPTRPPVLLYSQGGAGQALLSDRQFPSLDFVPGGTPS